MNFKGKEYKLSAILPWIATATRQQRGGIIAIVALGIATVAFNFLFVWATKQAIDGAIAHKNGILQAACFTLVGIAVMQTLISATSRRIKTMQAFRLNRRMQQSMLSHALTSDWSEISAYHTGDLARRITSDTATVTGFTTSTLPTALLVTLQLAGAYIFLMVLNWRMAVAMMAIMLAGIFASKFHFLKIRAFSARIKEGNSMLQAALQEALQNIPVLKALEGISVFKDHYNRIFNAQEANVKKRLNYTIASSTILNAGFAACYLFIFIWGVNSLSSSAITYGTLMAFVQLVGQIQGPARTLIGSVSEFAEFYTSCERLNEIDNITSETTGAAALPAGLPDVECDNLTYSYPDGKHSVISGFSHVFKAGTFTAVIGPTGKGKTTLLRLMLQYIRPNAGHVRLVYGNFTAEASAATRQAFAYVPQGNTLFSMTLRENLQLANPNATDAEMQQALAWACADFLKPGALDEPCGENGRGLSQGQTQRICIARALLSPAPVLLMDEATSALDHETEEKIIRNIHTNVKNKTIIFVTHRETALHYADSTVSL